MYNKRLYISHRPDKQKSRFYYFLYIENYTNLSFSNNNIEYKSVI